MGCLAGGALLVFAIGAAFQFMAPTTPQPWSWPLAVVWLYGTLLLGAVALLRRREWGRRLLLVVLVAVATFLTVEFVRGTSRKYYGVLEPLVAFTLAGALLHPEVRAECRT